MVFGSRDRELNIPVNMIGVEKANAKLKGLETGGTKSANAISSAFSKLGGVLAGVFAVREVTMFFRESIRLAGEYESALLALNIQTSRMGVASEDLVQGLRRVTQGQVALVDLTQAANKAIALMGREAIPRFEELAEVAFKASKVMGISVTDALDSIVLGISRQSRLILDNIGIVLSVTQANEAYAESLGKTVKELTDAERQMAFLNGAIEQGMEKFGDMDTEITTLISSTETLEARLKDLRTEIGTKLIPFQIKWNERLLATASILGGDLSLALNQGAKDLENYLASLLPVVALYQSIRRDIEFVQGGISTGFTGPGGPDLGAFSQFGVMAFQGPGPQVTGTIGPPAPSALDMVWQIDPLTGRAIMAPVGWAESRRKKASGGGGIGDKRTSAPAGMPPWLSGVIGRARTTPGGIGIGQFGTGLTPGPTIFDRLAGMQREAAFDMPIIPGFGLGPEMLAIGRRSRRQRRLNERIAGLDEAFAQGGRGGLMADTGALIGAGAGILTGNFGGAASALLSSSALGLGAAGPLVGMFVGGIINSLTRKRPLAQPVEPIPVKVMNWDGLGQFLNVTKSLLAGGVGRGIDRLNDLRAAQAQVPAQ